jgi:FkbM family methyltransferase
MENIWLDSVITEYKKYYGDFAPIIMDIGTRDGDDAQFFKENLNSLLVYAFDANPKAALATKEKYPEFDVFDLAVSNYNGTTTFMAVDTGDKNVDGCSSIYASKIVANEGNNFAGKYTEIETAVTRMDTFIEKAGLSNAVISIVKVDIEGFTYECIEGFGEYVKSVLVFHLETERTSTHPNHKDNLKVAELMHSLGFALVDVSYEWGWGIQDQVWINKALVLDQTLLDNFIETSEV